MSRESRSQHARERSEQERERDRLERERRRAGRGASSPGGESLGESSGVEQVPATWLPAEEPSGIPSPGEPADVPMEHTELPPPPEPSTAAAESPPPRIAEEPPLPPDELQDPQASAAPWVPSASYDLPVPAVAAAGGSRRRPGRRSALARAAAVFALAAVALVVWLVLQSLFGSGHSKPVAAPAAVRVVIPEGKTRLQIAQIAQADGLVGSYRAASRRSALLNPAHYGAPRGTPDLEGFLFPATYDMNPSTNVGRLVDEQLTTFRQRFGASEIRRAHALGVTPYELLTVASMVEREALTDHDRPLIAAVIYNRLHQGMPLGIDATIYYAVELQKGVATYTHELTTAQLHIESPYNTRTHKGLPPTPISNPGVASIEAAAHPAHVPYLYYVAAADGCGEQRFSTTFAQFERDAAAYQAAVAKNGGTSPRLQGQVMPRLGVLGWPVAHSRSPAIHNAAFASLGMAGWRYQRLPVPPELFEQTTRALEASGFIGANVTIPHKEAALRLADRASEAARAIGAANTLTFGPEGVIAAENTDAPGLIAALGVSPRGMSALVLGAGGSARAAVWALREAGASEVSVWNRTPERARALARDLGVRAVSHPERADMLINCTSVGLERSDPLDQLELTPEAGGRVPACRRPGLQRPGADPAAHRRRRTGREHARRA